MKTNQCLAVIGIVVADLLLLALGTFGAQLAGSRVVSFATASIAIVTFLGLFAILFTSDRMVEGTMRNAIAGATIATYLSIVGMTTFFSLTTQESTATLTPMTKTMIDSFQSVVMVVVGFYFTSSLAVEAIQRLKTGNAKEG